MSYDFKAAEEKWQSKWEAIGLGEVDVRQMEKKYYILTMFPYPSGDRLHIGHWYQYGIVDAWARFKRMSGKNVFQPIGFDAFGLPAENFAIKKGIHPDTSTAENVAVMTRQFRAMGVTYAWRYLLNTSQPDYYRWTQWLFLQLYKKGLAYRKEAHVNWCPSCQTVLANEQVKDGACERCNSIVTQKSLKQWFFKITDYAERLLNNIDVLDWPERTKAMQKHWIGRSEGVELDFALVDRKDAIRVFTTRPDTLFGVTYLVLSPEHSLVLAITSPERLAEVGAYVDRAKNVSELDRQSSKTEKTGAFTGAYAIHPLSRDKIPVWVADYVLSTYGSGAVMAVPAHDERDFEFARKYQCAIRRVVRKADETADSSVEAAYVDEGIAVNSGKYDGMTTKAMLSSIIADVEREGFGVRKVNYRLRDWLVSRQRYWGTPIPIVHCASCGEVAVAEASLPVLLPANVDFKPTGESPLKRCRQFLQTKCPKCAGPAEREADTLDTFVCSSWYFLRFPNVGDDSKAFDPALTNRILPVDKYVGGPEHACMHLLYARFITMTLRDAGLLNFDEPFPSLVHQGLVLGKDGQKMSKSKGNSVSPDPYVDQYGSDAMRLYLMFGFNYIEGGPWDDGGLKAIIRFLDRLIKLFDTHLDIMRDQSTPSGNLSEADKKLLHLFHSTIARATADTDRFQFNTSLARYMELLNGIAQYQREVPELEQNRGVLGQVLRNFVLLMAPFAPHFAEEYWERLGNMDTVFSQPWPVAEEKALQLERTKMAVTINGKVRGEIEVATDASDAEIREAALAAENVQKFLEGKSIVKVIVVPRRLINLIVK